MKEGKRPRLTVDAIIAKEGRILLVKRRYEPYKGYWALPGGFVEWGETVEEALKREVLEETGLKVDIGRLVNVYSEPDRDPRGHSITVAYSCGIVGGSEQEGDDAAEVGWFPLHDMPRLGFDHEKIVREALKLQE
ncbi:MAG: NUDIX hydrolase [Candidatus Altiarchaeota archaeon]|nr:NUDIX hydrolase [Candidatus Altiarchaeota archaeon]